MSTLFPTSLPTTPPSDIPEIIYLTVGSGVIVMTILVLVIYCRCQRREEYVEMLV